MVNPSGSKTCAATLWTSQVFQPCANLAWTALYSIDRGGCAATLKQTASPNIQRMYRSDYQMIILYWTLLWENHTG
jgi:hypothetical protein